MFVWCVYGYAQSPAASSGSLGQRVLQQGRSALPGVKRIERSAGCRDICLPSRVEPGCLGSLGACVCVRVCACDGM